MARKFLNTVRSEIATLLADNTAGDISAADLRTCLSDTLDSTYNAGGSIVSTVASPGNVLTAAWVPVPFATESIRNSEPTFVEVVTGGSCQVKAPAVGFALDFIIEATVNVPNNENIQFAIFQNGVLTRWTAEAVGAGGGAGDPRSIGLSGILVGSVGTVDVRWRCPTNATINLLSSSFVLTVRPTNAAIV